MKEITISNFTSRRGDFELKPVNLKIGRGEIFVILGRTGSGKSVLLEAIGGMFRGASGEILYDGRNVADIPPGRRSLGFLYQDHALFPHMTVEQNIGYGLKMHRIPKHERMARTKELMSLLSIEHLKDQYPGTLSGGESQRTALARALALRPDVLLLDEPFSALDPSTKKAMYREIRNIHREFPCTIVFVTHDFNEARILADRIGILLDGELAAVTDSSGLMTGHFDSRIEKFLGRDEQ